MLSFALSAVAFLAASFFIRRWLEQIGIPKTLTRSIVIFVAAAALSYGVAFAIDLVFA